MPGVSRTEQGTSDTKRTKQIKYFKIITLESFVLPALSNTHGRLRPLLQISTISLADSTTDTIFPVTGVFGTIRPMSTHKHLAQPAACLLYTSDAADDLLCVDLGGRRIIK